MSDDEFEDDDFEDDDFEDDDYDDVAPEGNRVVGARARASVEHIAKHLVDDPEGVFVDASERGGDHVTLLVHASPGDLGRIIGKRGRVIQAIRQVARAAGSTEDVRVTVDVAE
jgi:predicted RNA-binding protein YlqC (UPF0109 family)